MKEVRFDGNDACRRGFSLLELVIAMFIFAIGMAGMFALATTMLRVNTFKGRHAQAMLTAEKKIEDLRNVDYSAIVTGTDTSQPPYTCEWAVTDETNLLYKTVNVKVSWSGVSGRTRKTSLRTIIAQ